jgi:hypothetical protein
MTEQTTDAPIVGNILETQPVRDKRNALLAETDWWAVTDRTMSAEETAYRQALRDVPQQEGFPFNITWPTKPE